MVDHDDALTFLTKTLVLSCLHKSKVELVCMLTVLFSL